MVSPRSKAFMLADFSTKPLIINRKLSNLASVPLLTPKP